MEWDWEAGLLSIFQRKPLCSTMKNGRAKTEQTLKFWGNIFERHKVQVFLNGHVPHYYWATKNGVH